MATPNQRKGDGFERELAQYLRSHDLPIVRQRKGGTADTGDFILGPILVEAKAMGDVVSGIRMALDQAERATQRFPGFIPAGFVKRPGYGVENALFVMRVRELPRLWLHMRES